MACIRQEILIEPDPEKVWGAVRDVGAGRAEAYHGPGRQVEAAPAASQASEDCDEAGRPPDLGTRGAASHAVQA
jgi:hypothetical protein